MKSWLLQVVIAFDQLLNALFCDGMADETMSANCWRMEQQGKFWGCMRPVIDAMFWFDLQHCKSSFEAERQRLQSPPEERL